MNNSIPKSASRQGRVGLLHPTPSVVDAAWVIGACIATVLGAVAGALFVDRVLHRDASDTIAGMLLGAAISMWLPLYFGVIHRRKWSLAEIGFRRGRHSLLHLIYQVPLTIFAAGILTLVLASILGVSPQGGSSTDESLHASPALAALAAIVTILVIPLAEEFVFRRILLDWFMTKMPTVAATTLVVVVFAVIHVAPPVMLYILFLGSALTGMRLWYGNLWAPVILHMCNNGVVSGIALLAVLL